VRAETPTSLVNQMSATRPRARTNSYFQDEDTGRFTSEVTSRLPKGASLGYAAFFPLRLLPGGRRFAAARTAVSDCAGFAPN
jgi:hypothetical protein